MSIAVGASTDGAVVVGHGTSASGSEAFRWTSAEGMVGLGDLPGGSLLSNANGISADGTVIVGAGNTTSDLTYANEAFRWTSEGGMVGLGDLPGGDFKSNAIGVSADGSVVVGQGTSSSGTEAFRWTSAGGLIGLGDLGGSVFNSQASSVSADGRVVVGNSNATSGSEAFVWTYGGGMIKLRDYLVANGVTNLTGWHLPLAMSVSADGRTIVGWGGNPSEKLEAWIATVPLPADANFDEVVNIFDINVVTQHWGEAGPTGDVNFDGVVNIFDVNMISSNWSGSAAAVPEPNSLVLAAGGLLSVAAAAWRRGNRLNEPGS